MAVYLRRAGSISSAVLFTVIFASQESEFVVNAPSHGASLGLLLFLLPGVVGSVLSHANKIIMPVLGALLASPLCLALFYIGRSVPITFWYQLTYLLSAIFWCACGALACCFIGAMFKRPVR